MRAIESPPAEGDHSSSSAPTDEREISSRLSSSSVFGDAELLRDLLVRRCAVQLLLERGDRTLDLARAGADGAWNPVERAELVDDRPADSCHREGLELDLPVGIEALDRADQPEEPVRHEILLVHVRRQARSTRPATNFTSGA